MSLKGKNAIVTGGSRGIGAAVVRDLANQGANVLINYTSPTSRAKCDEILAALPQAQHGIVQADMSQVDCANTIVDAARALWGDKIDILIHNAGKSTKCLLEDETPDGWAAVMDTNCRGVWLLTQAALPYIPKGGRIIIVGSISGRMGGPKQMSYAASKAVVESFVKVWTNEFGKARGICINAVAPGPVDTDMFNSNVKEYIEQSVNANGLATPQQISDGIMFLASEKSSWVTGSILSTNGGALMT